MSKNNDKPKFTPGPWKVGNDTGMSFVVEPYSGPHIGNIRYSHNPAATREIGLANANLIAASPCLFDKLSVALGRLKEKSDGSNRDLGLIQSIEKTLNKALGDA